MRFLQRDIDAETMAMIQDRYPGAVADLYKLIDERVRPMMARRGAAYAAANLGADLLDEVDEGIDAAGVVLGLTGLALVELAKMTQ